MYNAQTLTTDEWTKQANAQTQARQPNKQMVTKLQADARCPSSKKKPKQQQ